MQLNIADDYFKAQKDIDSGKNAERCKRYYERHRAEILAKAKAKREAMKI